MHNRSNERNEATVQVRRLEDAGTGLDSLSALSDVDQFILTRPTAKPIGSLWAVVVGIEKYRRLPEVRFARRDAIAVREYFERALGVPKDHITTLLDDDATKLGIQIAVADELSSHIKEGDTVFVYFAGHGAPGYLIPSDGTPQSLVRSGYRLDEFYHDLAVLKTNRVVVFIDACFSGMLARTDRPEPLVKDSRPVMLSTPESVIPQNVAGIAGSSGNELSNAYQSQAHGLFTYYLLKGISELPQGRIPLSQLSTSVTSQVEERSRDTSWRKHVPKAITFRAS